MEKYHNPELEVLQSIEGDVKKDTQKDSIVTDIRNIRVNFEDNMRIEYNDIEELADSIAKNGLLHPLVVSTIRGTGEYLLVDGHRRYKAMMLLLERAKETGSLEFDPRIEVKRVPNNPEVHLTYMLVTGVQKQTLHPVEQAMGFARLQRLGWSVKKIAELLGNNKEQLVYRYLKLAQAPEIAKQKCLQGLISHDTLIKIIEQNGGDYHDTLDTVETAISNAEVVNEAGEKVQRKVQTKDIKKLKKVSFFQKLKEASDELFKTSEEQSDVLDEFLKIATDATSVEELKEFFSKVKFK
jgi:ParB family chromosome partitioning protein